MESQEILNKIQTLLKERDWTLYRLSERSGVPQSTLSNLFKRNNAPTIPTLSSICSALGISLAEFFSDGTEGVFLTKDQSLLLSYYIQFNTKQKHALIEFLKTL